MTQGKQQGDAVLKTFTSGLIAGYAAEKAMYPLTVYMYDHEDQFARIHEDQARKGRAAYDTAAEKISTTLGLELGDEGRKRLAWGLHTSLALGAGVVYAFLRKRTQRKSLASGLAFGFGFFLLFDEGLNWAAGFTPGPREFPWQAHFRGLAAHLLYGAVAEFTLRAIESAPVSELPSRLRSKVPETWGGLAA